MTADELDATGLVGLLRISAAGGDESEEGWPDDPADRWSGSDELLGDVIGYAVRSVNRWCTVGGGRLAAFQLGATLVPVLVDLDDESILGAREIGRFTWFSESGGAPVSGTVATA